MRNKHKRPPQRQTGPRCPRCGDAHSYVVIKGVEVCNHCKQPLPTANNRQFTAFAWVSLAARLPQMVVS